MSDIIARGMARGALESIAEPYDDGTTYAEGDYCIKEGRLCQYADGVWVETTCAENFGGGGGGGGVTTAQKNALRELLECVAFDADSEYGTKFNAFLQAWGLKYVTEVTVTVDSSATVYEGRSAKEYLSVTATYSDGTQQTVTNYGIVPETVQRGTNTYTVTFGGVTATASLTTAWNRVYVVTPADIRQGVANTIWMADLTSGGYGRGYWSDYLTEPTATKKKRAGTPEFYMKCYADKTYKYVCDPAVNGMYFGLQMYYSDWETKVNAKQEIQNVNYPWAEIQDGGVVPNIVCPETSVMRFTFKRVVEGVEQEEVLPTYMNSVTVYESA